MAEDCCTPSGNIMILACSGCSNVGQLSNQAAVELTQEGFGNLILTDLGIEKNKDLNLNREAIDRVKQAAKATCAGAAPA